ncbi:Histone H1 [Komagataella phaffii CBS 7435]|uniref:Histone H1 n=2 Tax=Komagataella phaffii TaxID=460519 RepID=C4QXZ5_KOMPG|nr:uncharacterized protein PAS_chr1-4_0282 [Komagataella phaffii GS115]CAH2446938.1 Histone H1 [Komagataella phaffii CBS 7435]CAY68118.1 Histone H1, a linker histone required for nucleosome packaging at restricted sites [Komagataella phaffii GS115]CCA37194.1 Histone H1 [Komagataella phaffii CBS 7435]
MATRTSKKAVADSKISYKDMITNAILSLKERTGSSRQAIKKHVLANYPVGTNFDSQFNLTLRRNVAAGYFKQPKGPSGPVKLNKDGEIKKDIKTVKKVTKPVLKKKVVVAPRAATKAKKTVVSKKSAPKKSSSTTAKKVPTKKAAPAKKTKTGSAAAKPGKVSKPSKTTATTTSAAKKSKAKPKPKTTSTTTTKRSRK